MLWIKMLGNFSMIPHTEFTMYDGFSFPCSHVDLDDDELNDDTY